ncbi:hypothetical protein O2K51_13065 [Apibacter raozihei]|uniref:hypothetical protein n=1 Tax=Apibacter TaxID=1778601 RepID=UPI000FE2FE8F|nr:MULTISPECIES: hypothetical protein [Apibacter]
MSKYTQYIHDTFNQYAYPVFQYAFIALSLILAVWYIVKLFRETFLTKKNGCGGTNCKCGRD